jgi:uncharacterized protein
MWMIFGEVAFYVVVVLLNLLGLVLTLFALPGIWLIWLVILGTAFLRGLEVIPLWFIILTFFFSVFVTIIDNFIIAYGAKRFGGGRWGMLGAVLGAILGLLVANLPGLLVGPFLGAFAMEYIMAKKKYDEAFKSGFGSSLGVVFAIVVKFFLSLFMIIIYFYMLIF